MASKNKYGLYYVHELNMIIPADLIKEYVQKGMHITAVKHPNRIMRTHADAKNLNMVRDVLR